MRGKTLTVDVYAGDKVMHELSRRDTARTTSSYKSDILSPNTLVVERDFEKDLKRDMSDVASQEAFPPYETLQHPQANAYSPPEPSIRLLFSLIPRRDAILFLLPAILSSIVAGGIAPFMTRVVGDVFNAFALFPQSGASAADKAALRSSVGISALELLALAAGAIALGSTTSALWISIGERNLMRIRSEVYGAVSNRDMEWFDTAMGAEDSVNADGSEGPLGAGGMMAKFNEDTDNVRNATSLASGMLIQYLTTCLTCLVLAFQRSWALTLVILSAIPALIIIQIFSQTFAGPHINAEKEQTAAAATLIDRALNAIATVKAFNAQAFELAAFDSVMRRIQSTTIKYNGVFGVSSAFGQFTSMAMFVQGFWFGAKLVRDGTVSAGDVMAVFWACLIAATNIQLCIPQLIILAKGKLSMVSLVELINPPPRDIPALRKSVHSTNFHQFIPISPTKFSKATGLRELRRIVPPRCIGELSLNNITFAYPSRPSIFVLQDVSLFFPASETTFVVGGSGSGKSTIAQLLVRMYLPLAGTIEIDEQDAAFVEEQWFRSHVAVVSQNCILFDGTVHENVAMGVAGLQRRPEDVTRGEVVRACTAALLHEFVRDLPNGYDTRLGNGGANLSGGQKQRLAIARAILRDPTVLVLDEATSALDAASRVLVFEAIKTWRSEKTTIVITHDLSQISSSDFVYVLKEGRVVEQGYRADLEELGPGGIGGEFLEMTRVQGATGGFPAKSDYQLFEGGLANSAILDQYVKHVLEKTEAERAEEEEEYGDDDLTIAGMSTNRRKYQSLSGWLERVPSLSRSLTISSTMSRSMKRRTYDPERAEEPIDSKRRKYQSLQLKMTPPKLSRPPSAFMPTPNTEDDDEFELEKDAVQRTASEALKRREKKVARINRSVDIAQAIEVEEPMQKTVGGKQNSALTSMMKLLREVYPSVPNKLIMLVGVFVCLLSGAMTPVFSALLSRLLFEVSIGAKNVHAINFFGGLVLAVTALDGILRGLNYFIMESGAMLWVTKMRKDCYARLLAQDKKFFDRTDNAVVRLVQTVITDGDDARNLLSVVLGNVVVVVTMLCVGLIWALVMGWQLTLAGLAIGPVFAVTMSVQANLAAIAERRNRSAREEIAKGYYECISNIRAVRFMSFEAIFRARFQDAVSRAYTTGIRGAFVEGCSFGVTNGLIYLAEALLFYVGAVLVANGTYSYLQMVSVLNLVVFTITIGSQLMAFTQKITKATQATEAMNRILALDTKTDESQGNIMPLIEGDIKFKNVCFAYPERPDVHVLKDASLTLRSNECVAIVGASGSGKSTIASLLQRLYEPTSGSITIGGINVRNIDIMHLRRHVSVVSQNPNLFDASVAENIAYGSASLSQKEIGEAARMAHVHHFIAGLPQGYQTHVGESAALISGGQAQRIAIARALARPARVLVLDECTSALDPASQAAVLDALREARVGRTTLVVTHKMAMMRMCDRIVVIEDGKVAEQGSYDELSRMKGVFARLTRAGEWSSA